MAMNLQKRTCRLLAVLSLVVMGLASCTESVDLSEQRRYDSEQVFNSFATNSAYEKVTVPGIVGADNFVYMQWIERGSGTEKPRMTDYVRVHYRGHLLTSWAADPTQGLFQSNFDQEVVSPMLVSSTVVGHAIALQNMRVGDRAHVIIPWYLAYGSRTVSGIPSFSALHFELRLIAIDGSTTNG